MGGKEIQQIIQNLIPQMTPNDRLIISPHRNILDLRKYLHESELGETDEICLKEDGQFYQIISLVKSVEFPKVSLYGDKIWKTEVGREYREHQLRTFGHHQDGASKAYFSYLGQLSC